MSIIADGRLRQTYSHSDAMLSPSVVAHVWYADRDSPGFTLRVATILSCRGTKSVAQATVDVIEFRCLEIARIPELALA